MAEGNQNQNKMIQSSHTLLFFLRVFHGTFFLCSVILVPLFMCFIGFEVGAQHEFTEIAKRAVVCFGTSCLIHIGVTELLFKYTSILEHLVSLSPSTFGWKDYLGIWATLIFIVSNFALIPTVILGPKRSLMEEGFFQFQLEISLFCLVAWLVQGWDWYIQSREFYQFKKLLGKILIVSLILFCINKLVFISFWLNVFDLFIGFILFCSVICIQDWTERWHKYMLGVESKQDSSKGVVSVV